MDDPKIIKQPLAMTGLINRRKLTPPARCHDCSCAEGQLHMFGCDNEKCPFCGGQLISCDCMYQLLGLINPKKFGPETNHLPPHIYQHGVSETQWRQWKALCEEKGRYPYVQWTQSCVRCNVAWPELFMVPNDEWAYYIEPYHRKHIICLSCYAQIRHWVDEVRGEPPASIRARMLSVWQLAAGEWRGKPLE